VGFWRENGGMLAPRSDQKSMPTSKGRFCKNYCKTNEVLMIFQGYGVERHQKSVNNPSKIKAQDGLPLSIVFWWILVGFGRQVGLENRAKSEKNRLKNASKK